MDAQQFENALTRAFDAGILAKTEAYAMPTAQGREEHIAAARLKMVAEAEITPA